MSISTLKRGKNLISTSSTKHSMNNKNSFDQNINNDYKFSRPRGSTKNSVFK